MFAEDVAESGLESASIVKLQAEVYGTRERRVMAQGACRAGTIHLSCTLIHQCLTAATLGTGQPSA